MQTTCYYVLLGVERNVSEEDLKRAYRKKAIQLHPDKNPDDPDANERFVELQEAYEILRDPQERAWYDAHREQILRGHTNVGAPTSKEQDELNGVPDLSKYFPDARPSPFEGFGDDPKGFYTVYRQVFESLASEEDQAYEAWLYRQDSAETDMEDADLQPFPMDTSFGVSSTPYVPGVREFYNFWLYFTTRKSFAWCDLYRLKEAPDRRIRRLMVRENKRLRERGKREYQETVRKLVAQIRLLDPRVQKQQDAAEDLKQKTRARHQQQKKEAQQARLDLANQYEEQSWSQIDDEQFNRLFGQMISSEDAMAAGRPEGDAPLDDEEENTDGFYCVLCHKKFNSEKAWQNHERSKKHLKAMEDVRQLMEEEEAEAQRVQKALAEAEATFVDAEDHDVNT